MALVDSGANCHIATMLLANKIGITIVKMVGNKRIDLAQKGTFMTAIGTINVGGLIGTMLVVPTASENLISTSLLMKMGRK
jgi:hypothetical protein